MKIKVLFNELSINKRLQTGWGVSFLVDSKILFDTGEDKDMLLHNMQVLGVNPDGIESVVISHDHWDHTGGLWGILDKRNSLKVYSCPGFSEEFKKRVKKKGAELVEADKITEIAEGIFITGEISCAYKGKYMSEQAIAVKTANGLTVITGCAHPGILTMLEKVKSNFCYDKIHLVAGGFHLKDSDKRAIEIIVEKFQKIGVMKAGPTHCSGDQAEDIFRKIYKKDFFAVKTGQEIEV